MAERNASPFATRAKDMTGMVFGQLWVLSRQGQDRHGAAKWLCRCSCGNYKSVLGTVLRRGDIVSCGCFNKRQRTHGGGKHPLYQIWYKMWARCTDPDAMFAEHYIGRGITVCDRWKDPHAFYADMGERPSKAHSLDRIDNNGNYEPSNCRWATKKQQSRNTRVCHRITFGGRTLTLKEWSEVLGVPYGRLQGRVKLGWTVERTLTMPKQHVGRRD